MLREAKEVPTDAAIGRLAHSGRAALGAFQEVRPNLIFNAIGRCENLARALIQRRLVLLW